jgi:hypothetical protein
MPRLPSHGRSVPATATGRTGSSVRAGSCSASPGTTSPCGPTT